VLGATRRDLARMVNEGTFREDLYFRLTVLQIMLPPLRERVEDIEALAQRLLDRQGHAGIAEALTPELRMALARHSFPGNIRELQHTIEKAVILSETSVIKPDDLFFRHSGTMSNQSFNTIEEMEKKMIHEALEKNNGNFTAAAEQLGITRQTLYNRLKKNRDNDQ